MEEKDKKIVKDFLKLLDTKITKLNELDNNSLISKIENKIKYCKEEILNNKLSIIEVMFYEITIKAYEDLLKL